SKAGTYGTAALNIATGVLTYTLDNNNPATQQLTANQAVNDTFAIVVTNGSLQATTNAVFNITGSNDAPTLTAAAQSAQLVEAGGISNGTPGTSTATIALTKGDPDGTTPTYVTSGWSETASGSGVYTKAGTYGTVTLTTATGGLAYTLDNSKPATEALTGGGIATETFSVVVTDGGLQGTAQAVFSIKGMNDAPTITATSPLTPTFVQNSGAKVGDVVATYAISDLDDSGLNVLLSDTKNYSLGSGITAGQVLLSQAGLSLVNSAQDLPAFTLTPRDGWMESGNSISFDPVVKALDTTAPTIKSVLLTGSKGQQNGWLSIGDKVSATVSFSEPIVVVGAPNLSLQIGAESVKADFVGTGVPAAAGDLVFEYTITSKQTDANGISIATNSLSLPTGASLSDDAGNKAVITHAAVADNASYKVDTTVSVPVISKIGDGKDKIVSNASGDKLITGTAEANAFVTISSGINSLGIVTASASGAWSFTLSDDNLATLGQGAGKTITAMAEDLAGNTSGASAAFAFSVATQPPDPPIIVTIGKTDSSGESDNIVSSVAGDSIIKGTSNAAPGAKITLLNGTTTLNSTPITLSSQGLWTYTLSTANLTSLGQGDKTLSATVTDSVGNISDASEAFPFFIDTVAPTITSVLLTSSSGAENDFLNAGDTVDATVTLSEDFSLTGAPTLKLLIDKSSVNATYISGESTNKSLIFRYTIPLNQTLSDTNGISIAKDSFTLPAGSTLTDRAGNKAVITHAAVSDNPLYKVDTTVNAPVISKIGDGKDKIVSNVSGDKLITGTAEANAFVTISSGINSLGIVTASASGAWSFTLSDDNLATLGQGTDKTITAIAEDLAGNISPPSSTFNFTIYTEPPTSPSIDTAGGTDGVISTANGDNIISGMAESGNTITLFAGASNLGTATASSNGSWSLSLTSTSLTKLNQGENLIKAKATDPIGQTSADSSFSLFIDTVAPTITSVLLTSSSGAENNFLNAGDTVDATVTLSEDFSLTGAPTLKLLIDKSSVNATYISGESTNNSLIFRYTIPLNQTLSDTNGISIAKDSFTLPAGSTLTDEAGNKAVITHAAVSDNPLYKVDTTVSAPVIKEAGGSDKTMTTATNDNLITGTAEANASVTVAAGSTILGTVTASGTGSWTLSLSDLSKVGYGSDRTITATAKDPAGNTSKASTAFTLAVFDTLKTGGATKDTLLGTDGVDSINGAVGDDTITGAGGNDFITLGAGKDVLIFGGAGALGSDTIVGTAAQVLANIGSDTISDYGIADDSIRLSRASFGGQALGSTGALSSNKFRAVNNVQATVGADFSSGGFVYDKATGNLFYTTANATALTIGNLSLTGSNQNAAIIGTFKGTPLMVNTEFSVID
ncbi:MAG: beta strand repeat-containing protein, partial [Cyanobacteriota bacterium]